MTHTETVVEQQISPPSQGRMVLVHTKVQILDLLRTPVAIVSTTIFPTLVFLFFILPQSGITDDPIASLVVTGQLATFGVMSAYLFSYGIGVAEERANPWFSYLRVLPVGPLPATLARFLTAALSALLSLLPLVAVVAIFTAAPTAFSSGELSWGRIPLTLALIVLAASPFLGIGLAIGYSMTSKAAIAVAQLVNFPLAFIGGLMMPPEMFPGWLNTISLLTPSRAARDAVVWGMTAEPMPPSTLPVLVGWSVVLLAVALWANRRDQGRRFR